MHVKRDTDNSQPLAPYRVLDLADAKGVYCSKILADLGADVIKVEPPEGSPTRRHGPFKDDIPHQEKSLPFLYYNTNKRGITLNLNCADGRQLLKDLVKTADAVVESSSPGHMENIGLGYSVLKEANPEIALVSITGFGQTGPFKDYKAPEIVSFAMSGTMYMCGDPKTPPCIAPGPLAYHTASAYAAVGILIALESRSQTGEGQQLEVSARECAMAHTDFSILRYFREGTITERRGRHIIGGPGGIYPCKDGHIMLIVIQPHFWHIFKDWIGNPPVFDDPIWDTMEFRQLNPDIIDQHTIEFTKQFTMEELYHQAQKIHLPLSPVNSCSDFFHSPQIKHRGFFQKTNHPEIGDYHHPLVPYMMGQTPCTVRRPSPRLGEHNFEIYCGELGLSKKDLAVLFTGRVI